MDDVGRAVLAEICQRNLVARNELVYRDGKRVVIVHDQSVGQ
jgi:hypothetical protein